MSLETEPIPNLFAQEDKIPVKGRSFANLQRFLTAQVAPVRTYKEGKKPDYKDGDIYFPPLRSGGSISKYNVGFEMMGEYLGLDRTLEEVGGNERRTKKTTRENVRIIIKRRTEQLYEASREEVKARFPFASFDFGKPVSRATGIRQSVSRGGISAKIAYRILQGQNLEDLKRDYSGPEISASKKVLRNWGIKIPREKEPVLPRFDGLRNFKASDEEIQTILDNIKNYDQVRVLKKAGYVVELTDVARKAGLNVSPQSVPRVSKLLKKIRVPQTKVPQKTKRRTDYFHVIAAMHEARVLDAFHQSRDSRD